MHELTEKQLKRRENRLRAKEEKLRREEEARQQALILRQKTDEKFMKQALLQAKKAKELEIEKFTTTLFVSPHKVRNDIIAEGKKAEKAYGVEFLDVDFRKKDGFLKTMKIAKAENFYRQTYCGCVFSIQK